jgi:hypothetical protein
MLIDRNIAALRFSAAYHLASTTNFPRNPKCINSARRKAACKDFGRHRAFRVRAAALRNGLAADMERPKLCNTPKNLPQPPSSASPWCVPVSNAPRAMQNAIRKT